MPTIADYRNKFPSLRELDDAALIASVAEVQGVPAEDVMAHMGYKPKSRNIAAVANDTVIETDDHVIIFLPDKSMVREVEKLFQVRASFF